MFELTLNARVTRSGRSFGALSQNTASSSYCYRPNSTFDISALLKRAIELEDDPNAAEDFNYIDRGSSPAMPSTPSHAPLPRPAGAQPSKNANAHAKRQRRRDERIAAEGPQPRPNPNSDPVLEYAPFAINIPLRVDALPSTSCGYRAKPKMSADKGAVHSLDYWRLDRGFPTLHWDGKDSLSVVDPSTGRGFMHLVAPPTNDSASFLASAERAFNKMEGARQSTTFKPSENNHCRGQGFVAINDGLYQGQGSKEPHRLNTGPHAPMLQELREDEDIQRLATYASSLATWAPDLHSYYHGHMRALLAHKSDLKPNFEKSVYPCAAFNFGPIVCCALHRDSSNCPFGFCAITSLGHFDHTRGGHLVIEELELIVEFPAGCTILLPSAVLTHCNTPVEPHEKRISFTQFMPGEILRYVDNGFRTQAELIEKGTPAEYAAMLAAKETRWEGGLKKWSVLETLVLDAKRKRDEAAERKAANARKNEELKNGKAERRKERKRRRIEERKEEGQL